MSNLIVTNVYLYKCIFQYMYIVNLKVLLLIVNEVHLSEKSYTKIGLYLNRFDVKTYLSSNIYIFPCL